MADDLNLLVDGSGFTYRAYFGFPKFTTNNGTPINAVYGVCSMLFSVISQHNYSNCLIALDKGRHTFRTDLYADYKANRAAAPDDLVVQFPIIRKAYSAFGFNVIEKEGYEADDIIASLTDKFVQNGSNVCIVSSDKDLMQLVNDKVYIFDPMKKKNVDSNGVYEKFGVFPNQIADFLALLGDASDNVPGVDGVGAKTAAKLLNEFGAIDGIYANMENVRPKRIQDSLVANKERLLLSRKLVSLAHDVDCECESLQCKIDYRNLIGFCKEYGFNSLVKTIEAQAMRARY